MKALKSPLAKAMQADPEARELLRQFLTGKNVVIWGRAPQLVPKHKT